MPEPDNPHDPGAIEIRFEGAKLGYVPASENGLMSAMAFFGHADVFEARVIKLGPAADPGARSASACTRPTRGGLGLALISSK